MYLLTILIASLLICMFTANVHAMDQALQEHDQQQEQMRTKLSVFIKIAKDVSRYRASGQLLLEAASLQMGIIERWGKIRALDDIRLRMISPLQHARADQILLNSRDTFNSMRSHYKNLLKSGITTDTQWLGHLERAVIIGGDLLDTASLYYLLFSNAKVPNYCQGI